MVREKNVSAQTLESLRDGFVWEGVGVEIGMEEREERDVSVRFWTRKNSDRYVAPAVAILLSAAAILFMSTSPTGLTMRLAFLVSIIAMVVCIGFVDYFGARLHRAMGNILYSMGFQSLLHVRTRTFQRPVPREVPVRIEVAADPEMYGLVVRWDVDRLRAHTLRRGEEILIQDTEPETPDRVHVRRTDQSLEDCGELHLRDTAVVWMRDAHVDRVVYVQLRRKGTHDGVTFRMQAPPWMDAEIFERLPRMVTHGVELGVAQERELVQVLALWMELSGQGPEQVARVWLDAEAAHHSRPSSL